MLKICTINISQTSSFSWFCWIIGNYETIWIYKHNKNKYSKMMIIETFEVTATRSLVIWLYHYATEMLTSVNAFNHSSWTHVKNTIGETGLSTCHSILIIGLSPNEGEKNGNTKRTKPNLTNIIQRRQRQEAIVTEHTIWTPGENQYQSTWGLWGSWGLKGSAVIIDLTSSGMLM